MNMKLLSTTVLVTIFSIIKVEAFQNTYIFLPQSPISSTLSKSTLFSRENDYDTSNKNNNESSQIQVGRRKSLVQAISFLTATTTASAASSTQANAEFIGSPPMILNYPSPQYLVPIYTLNSALDVLYSQLTSETNLGIQRSLKVLDNFFSGGFLSKKNVFKGLCTIYVQEIQYDDPDKNRIYLDRMARLDDCDNSLKSLEQVQSQLNIQLKNQPDANTPNSEVMKSFQDTREYLQAFFNKIPKKNVEEVTMWIQVVNQADTDRNGKLEGDELSALNEEELKLYKAVGELIGS